MQKRVNFILGLAFLILCLTGCGKAENSHIANETESVGTETAQTSVQEENVKIITPAEVPEPLEKSDSQDAMSESGGTKDGELQPLTGEEKEQQEMEIWIENRIADMSLEDQVAQLFIVGNYLGLDLSVYPVGGLIYFESDLQDPDQTRQMLQTAKDRSLSAVGVTVFTTVDEEGGSVTRVAGNPAIELADPGNMVDLGGTGDTNLVRVTLEEVGTYLSGLGFNTDFAPVADVYTDISNYYTKLRAFSNDPQIAADMVKAAVQGLHDGGVCTAVKHFPGLGYTSEDSHEERTITTRTLKEMQQWELLPFQAAIDAGTDFVMVGHVTAENVDESGLPATMSSVMVNGILREQMGYDGIVLTDAMNMGAIVNRYSSGEAAVQALLAGVDMILMPADLESAYYAVLDAVQNGTISEEQLHTSFGRILKVKYKMKTD